MKALILVMLKFGMQMGIYPKFEKNDELIGLVGNFG